MPGIRTTLPSAALPGWENLRPQVQVGLCDGIVWLSVIPVPKLAIEGRVQCGCSFRVVMLSEQNGVGRAGVELEDRPSACFLMFISLSRS